MVYCGKPSKGCQACRDRKTRCDRQAPSCGQCIRTSRVCPGYRSELDLMFRNESEAVIGKAKAKERYQKISKSPQHGSSSRSTNLFIDEAQPEYFPVSETPLPIIRRSQQTSQLFTVPSLAVSIVPTANEYGQGYFNSTSHTWLPNYDLTEIICNQGNKDDHLLACMSAVGLAVFSHSIQSPQLMHRARKDYITALRLTNAALRSPTEAKKDSTLFAVMIMSVFEMITGDGEQSLAAWTDHINGSAAVLALRGPDQLKTAVGRRLFMQVMSNLLISCIQRTVAMPEHLVRLRSQGSRYFDQENPAWILTNILIDVTIFRAAVRNMELVGPKAIIQKGLALDQRFIEFFSDPPEAWKFTTVYVDDRPDEVWAGYYDVYQDYWAAQVCNGMRTSRITIHEVIHDQMLTASCAHTPIFTADEIAAQTAASVETMLSLQAGILASVPQYTLAVRSHEGQKASVLGGSRGAFLQWPLYLAGTTDVASREASLWVAKQLRRIGEMDGVSQAVALADFIESGYKIRAWDLKPTPVKREVEVVGSIAEEISDEDEEEEL